MIYIKKVMGKTYSLISENSALHPNYCGESGSVSIRTGILTEVFQKRMNKIITDHSWIDKLTSNTLDMDDLTVLRQSAMSKAKELADHPGYLSLIHI